MQNIYNDHKADRGHVSMSHYNLVHKLISIPKAVKSPEAKAALDKEWETYCIQHTSQLRIFLLQSSEHQQKSSCFTSSNCGLEISTLLDLRDSGEDQWPDHSFFAGPSESKIAKENEGHIEDCKVGNENFVQNLKN